MTIDEVKELYYNQKLSAKEIGLRFNKTVWQVIKFMKKHGLKRRSSKETNEYAYFRRPLTYKKKEILTSFEQQLLISGLMLYWAEGAKNTGAVVDLVNSDPLMLKLFIKMMRTIYQVQEKKFRVLIYCYRNQNVDDLKAFWSDTLGVPIGQFLKSFVRQDYDQLKNHKLPKGVAHIRYYDKKLYTQIQKDTDIIAKSLLS